MRKTWLGSCPASHFTHTLYPPAQWMHTKRGPTIGWWHASQFIAMPGAISCRGSASLGSGGFATCGRATLRGPDPALAVYFGALLQ